MKNINCGPLGFDILSVFPHHERNNTVSWFDSKNVIYFHKARVAIHYACKVLNIKSGDHVLAPAYNCGVEIDPIIKNGVRVSLYRIDETGQIDLSDLQKRIDANTKMIYITHYFGFFQPLESIRKICNEKGIYLIEDCALSLFSKSNNDTKIGSTGDISIFNFYKTLPVPDGGCMVINNPALIHDHPVMLASPHLKVIAGLIQLLKHFVLRKISIIKALYNLIRYGMIKNHSIGISSHGNKDSFPEMPASYYYYENLSLRKMSCVSKYMLKRMDYNQIIQKRRRNFQKYLQGLKNIENIKFLYTELPEGVCPLWFPIIAGNPGYICKQLYKFSIVTIPWWTGYHKSLSWPDYPEACYLKDHLLALPVHQQLQERHIDYIIEKLVKMMNE